MNKLKFICACSDLGVSVDGAQLGPTKLITNFTNYNYSIIERPYCIKSNDPLDLKKNLKEHFRLIIVLQDQQQPQMKW